ncbi:uncharacterized protein TNCV_2034631 [Trichonephila clavipes]|nr:uncharacterized protein TNCV_2034631 [Trichonephila clavipes]
MGAGDQTKCLRTCHLSKSHLDVSGSHISPTANAPYHHRASISLNNLLLTLIHEVVSIPVHIRQLDSIGNETRQTRQRVSNHRQSNVGVNGHRRDVKPCVVQSTRVHEWDFGSESPYR